MEFIGHGINISEDSLLCQPCNEQGGSNSALQCFTESLELSNTIPVLLILNSNTINIGNPDFTIEPGHLFAIDQDTNPNNGVYQIQDILTPNPAYTQIILLGDGVPVPEQPPGTLIFAKSAIIEHNLDSSHLIYQILSSPRNEVSFIKTEVITTNQLLLRPTLPMKGNFTVTIISKNTNDNDQP